MFVVAIAALATSSSTEVEASALAVDLGNTTYEARLLLAVGLPAVVLTTVDRERARSLLARIRARGHEAVAFDTAAVVASGAMIPLRAFNLGETAITLQERPELELPYDDVLAILRASHRRLVDTTTESKEKKFSPGLALATGGLMLKKSVSKQASSSIEEREQVLYLFRRSGQTPWLLREGGGRYRGPDLAPTTLENFTRTVAKLRQRAPGAAYDDRLMTTRKVAEHTVRSSVGGVDSVTTMVDGGVDLAAHLLVMGFARRVPAHDTTPTDDPPHR